MVTETTRIFITTHRTDKVDNELAELAKQFAKEFPGAEIEFVGIKDSVQTLQTQMATRTLTDITKWSCYQQCYSIYSCKNIPSPARWEVQLKGKRCQGASYSQKTRGEKDDFIAVEVSLS